ncbi:hypothetical protein GCM10022416_08600 [Actinomadura keratinilytica]|uniref:Uncharacterized protein n=1 Tax=Actinomadura keratinilytica TaxID=547461 RepID=A0ABP7Y4N4_9ACTN
MVKRRCATALDGPNTGGGRRQLHPEAAAKEWRPTLSDSYVDANHRSAAGWEAGSTTRWTWSAGRVLGGDEMPADVAPAAPRSHVSRETSAAGHRVAPLPPIRA